MNSKKRQLQQKRGANAKPSNISKTASSSIKNAPTNRSSVLDVHDSDDNDLVNNMLGGGSDIQFSSTMIDDQSLNPKDGSNISTSSTAKMPSLKSIWDCSMINLDEDKKGWKCLYCNKSFKQGNATKAMMHVTGMKLKNQNSSKCKSVIPAEKMRQYRELWMEKQSDKSNKESHKVMIDDITNDRSKDMEQLLPDSKRYKSASSTASTISDSLPSPPIINLEHDTEDASETQQPTKVSSKLAQFFAPAVMNKKPTNTPSISAQMTLVTNSKNPEVTKKADIAIANYVHSLSLPFSTTEDFLFKKMCDAIRLTSVTYKPPTRGDLGGKLLDANYAAHMNRSKDSKLLINWNLMLHNNFANYCTISQCY